MLIMNLLHGVNRCAGQSETELIQDGLVRTDQRIWVEGKDGRPVLNITVQELQDLERKVRDSSEIPLFISSNKVSVRATEALADVEARIAIESPGNSVVRQAELRLKNIQLVELPLFLVEEGTEATVKNGIVTADEGYRWLQLSSEPGRHTAVLTGKNVVSRNADRFSFNLDLPFATTTIEVVLPPNAMDARVRSEDLIESKTQDENSTHLIIRSRGGNFTLSWRPSTEHVPIAAVEAKCDTQFEPSDPLDSAQFWSATSTISIRWMGFPANNKVQLRLPLGAQLNALPFSEPDRFRVASTVLPTVVEAGKEELSTEVVEIENLNPAEYPAIESLKLQWRWLPQKQQADRMSSQIAVDLPQLAGVDSLEGMVEIVFPESIQASFKEGPGIRFLQHNKSASLPGRDQLQFQHKGLASSFELTFRKQQVQPMIRPIYLVQVHGSKLELTAWIKCASVADQLELGFLPGDWTVDEDSVCQLMDTATPHSNDTVPLTVQRIEDGQYILRASKLDLADASPRQELLWRLTAWRDLASPAEQSISLQIPRIDRGRMVGQSIIDHGSGELILSSDNSLMLEVDENNTSGLIRNPVSADLDAYVLPQYRRFAGYRFQRHSELPTWQGKIRALPQQISASQSVDVEVQPTTIVTQQNFQIRVQNRPLSSLKLRLDVRATVLRATVGDVPLTLEEVPNQEAGAAESVAESEQQKQFELTGIPEIMGEVPISIQSAISWIPPTLDLPPANENPESSKAVVSLAVPLAQLVIDQMDPIAPSSGMISSSRQFIIESIAKNVPAMDGKFEISHLQPTLELIIRAKTNRLSPPVVAKQIWLQSMFNGTYRRERFVARVSSDSKQVLIQLPEQTQPDRVAVDGTEQSSDLLHYDFSTRRVTVVLPDQQVHTVEIVYQLTEPLAWAARVKLNPAKVVDAPPYERFYWQLITPSAYHLGWYPVELSALWQWVWQDYIWNRESLESQASLEQKLQAAALPSSPIDCNSYVLSGLGDLPQTHVWVLTRIVLWLPIGALSIAISMLVLNLPVLRSPSVFLLFCALLGATALALPELSILVAHAAMASVTLVTLVWITQSAVQSKIRRRSVFTAKPITATDISDIPSHRVRTGGSQGSASKPSAVGTD